MSPKESRWRREAEKAANEQTFVMLIVLFASFCLMLTIIVFAAYGFLSLTGVFK